jgi:branched-subunit amino acid ABC-type transport system permease component
MGVLVTQVFNGLSVGSILLLAALGLALTFGQMGVINMAHGEFIMAGAYTAYVTNQILGSAGLSLLLSLPIAFVVAGLLGVLLEATLLRRMYHRPLDTLLVTWGARWCCSSWPATCSAPRVWTCRPRPGCRAPSRSSGSPSPSRGCSSWRCRSRRSRRWPPG